MPGHVSKVRAAMSQLVRRDAPAFSLLANH